jgi:hypothetical protein
MTATDDQAFEAARIAEFTQFIAERGVTEKCDACGRHDWTVAPMRSLFALSTFPFPTFGMDQQVLDGRHFQPIIITACKNCGFVRLFSSNVLAQWKFEKGLIDGV